MYIFIYIYKKKKLNLKIDELLIFLPSALFPKSSTTSILYVLRKTILCKLIYLLVN